MACVVGTASVVLTVIVDIIIVTAKPVVTCVIVCTRRYPVPPFLRSLFSSVI